MQSTRFLASSMLRTAQPTMFRAARASTPMLQATRAFRTTVQRKMPMPVCPYLPPYSCTSGQPTDTLEQKEEHAGTSYPIPRLPFPTCSAASSSLYRCLLGLT